MKKTSVFMTKKRLILPNNSIQKDNLKEEKNIQNLRQMHSRYNDKI